MYREKADMPKAKRKQWLELVDEGERGVVMMVVAALFTIVMGGATCAVHDGYMEPDCREVCAPAAVKADKPNHCYCFRP